MEYLFTFHSMIHFHTDMDTSQEVNIQIFFCNADEKMNHQATITQTTIIWDFCSHRLFTINDTNSLIIKLLQTTLAGNNFNSMNDLVLVLAFKQKSIMMVAFTNLPATTSFAKNFPVSIPILICNGNLSLLQSWCDKNLLLRHVCYCLVTNIGQPDTA